MVRRPVGVGTDVPRGGSVISFTYQASIVASWARARKKGKKHFNEGKHASAMLVHRAAANLAKPAGWTLDGVYEVAVIYARHGGHARDADRVLNLVLDALKGCAWKDDSDARVRTALVTRLDGSGTFHDVRARDHFRAARWFPMDATESAQLDALPDGHTLVTVTRIGDGRRAKR